MFGNGGEYDGASFFSGGGFMPSQATQVTDSGFSPSKNRENQVLLPLTVKQISGAHQTSDDRSNFVIDGVDVNNITLVGMVKSKLEKVTDVSFQLDDGTGSIEVHRWVDDATESNELAGIQNGRYVCVHGHLKAFQGKKQISAYSCRLVTDYDQIAHHFIECIYVHKYNKTLKVATPPHSTITSEMSTPYRGVASVNQPVFDQFSSRPGTVNSENDLQRKVLAIFDEPRCLRQK